MSSRTLTPVSYLVLGLIAERGPATPYELKRRVAGSVGHFWTFPHSQLYAEPARLAREGLLAEQREPAGRRRRTYRLTDAGRGALRRWLAEPTTGSVELRDPGLLKLFFAGQADDEELARLVATQEAAHRARLREYERIESGLAVDQRSRYALATLRMGLRHEQAAVSFWREVSGWLLPGDDAA
ncbi:MAG: PadR family transcriptional regulator [Actinobacteria bacterium]|nr:PadR family transcriptional regulator [Actinomycetota bacterium]